MKNIDIYPYIVPLPIIPQKLQKIMEVLKNRYK
jgi:hypothetical protein